MDMMFYINKIGFLLVLMISSLAYSQSITIEQPVRYLALGDSYTIGTSVTYEARFPSQLFDSLKVLGYETDTLDYIATWGDRTDELYSAISSVQPDSNYNLVSLLIGVNNQYQGRPFTQYEDEFPELLEWAIALAGGVKERVFVVSIPDYSYTPTSASPTTSTELDNYNDYAEHVCDSVGVNYFYITDISREGLNDPSLVAGDNLHPSGKQYGLWVDEILKMGVLTFVEEEWKEAYSIYPNPTSSMVQLFDEAKWVLYDARGKEVERGFSDKIDMTMYLEGLYYIRMGNKIFRVIRD